MTNRKKTGAAVWATVVVVALLVAYPLSFGPACWMVGRGLVADRPVAQIYMPIVVLISESEYAHKIAVSYAKIGSQRPQETIVRLLDAAGLIRHKTGMWPADSEHDRPYRSGDVNLKWL